MSSFANPNDTVLTQPRTLSQLRSALQASKSTGLASDVAAIETSVAAYLAATDVVSATATFDTDNAVLCADGTARGAQSSTAIVADTGALQLTNDSTLETSGSHAPVLAIMDSGGIAAFEVTAFTNISGNLAIGPDSGLNITTGVNNTFIGQESGLAATEGSYNVAIGRYSAWNLTTGINNLFIGFNSGPEVRGGSFNTLIGQSAGVVLTEGLHNVVVGRSSLTSLTTGSFNVCLGNSALTGLETGAGNIAIGAASLESTTDSDNIGIGRRAGRYITSGGGNIAIGSDAASGITTGDTNICLGESSGYTGQLGDATDCVIIGAGSFTTASDAIVIGANASAGAGEISIGNTTHGTVRIHGILEQATEPSNANQLWDSGGYVMLSDGAARSRFFETYAEGTAYTLTATAAAAVFGTTSPVIVLDQPGTYRVYGMAVIEYIDATFDANQAVTLTLRRTNNTAANLSPPVTNIFTNGDMEGVGSPPSPWTANGTGGGADGSVTASTDTPTGTGQSIQVIDLDGSLHTYGLDYSHQTGYPDGDYVLSYDYKGGFYGGIDTTGSGSGNLAAGFDSVEWFSVADWTHYEKTIRVENGGVDGFSFTIWNNYNLSRPALVDNLSLVRVHPGSTIIHTLQIVTDTTGTAAIVNWEAPAYTTANTTDSLTIFADVAVLPSAGRVDLSQSFIKAERLP